MKIDFVRLAALAIAAGLLVYVALRAIVIPITIDEALTFSWHLPGTWTEIALLRTPGLEDNNHVLLTLLAKASVGVFGVSEFAIRLPSLLGYVLFLASTYFILGRIGPWWLRLLGLLTLGINPYLVDYFTIARGYGLALGLAMTGIALLLDAMRDRDLVRRSPAYAAFFFFTLAAIAQLTFILVLVAGYVVLWAPYLLRRQALELWGMLRPRTPAAWLLLGVIAILQGYVLHLMLVIKRVGLLETGQARGFWSGTVGSLIDGMLPDAGEGIRIAALVWVVATVAIALIAIYADRLSGRRSRLLAVLLGLLVVVAVVSVMQHVMLGVALLDGRRGISLLALFLLCALALPASVPSVPVALRVAAVAAGLAVPALLAVHGVMTANLDYIRDWPHDAAAREMMMFVKGNVSKSERGPPLVLRTFWPLAPAAEFYRRQLELDHAVAPITLSDRPGYLGPADLYYVLDDQRPEVLQQGATPLADFPKGHTSLLAGPSLRTGGR